ncbi:MAG: signal peptidase I [Candidatus Omnitrophota bacterium]|nr:signal peptidase I [Candidatus Omnitrophota bacterium]
MALKENVVNSAKPKEPWIAVLLSQLLPGLGHIYAKRKFKGLIYLGITVICILLGIIVFRYVLGISDTISILFIILGAPLGIFYFLFRIYVLVDSYKCTKKYNSIYKVNPSQKKLRIVAIATFLLLFSFSLSSLLYLRSYVYQVFRIPNASMVPALKPGDKVVLDRKVYSTITPKRGDIVVFIPPHDKKKYYCKRIIGLPGESVQIKDGVVYINGEKIKNSIIAKNYYYNEGDYAMKDKEIMIPPSHYYVLGDNSVSSFDSRFFGFVPSRNIKGKVTKIFLPQERAGKLE